MKINTQRIRNALMFNLFEYILTKERISADCHVYENNIQFKIDFQGLIFVKQKQKQNMKIRNGEEY